MLGNLGADYKKQEEYFSSQKYKDKFKKGKGSGKRKLPHPKMLSYPVAVTPDEENGTRLLIKCFEYIPPKHAVETFKPAPYCFKRSKSIRGYL